MKDGKAEKMLLKGNSYHACLSGKEVLHPNNFFGYQELIKSLEEARMVKPEAVINAINHIHFINGTIQVCLYHTVCQVSVLSRACPEPCLGETLTCRWADENPWGLGLEKYEIRYLLVDDGRSMITIPARCQKMAYDSFSIQMPETCYRTGQRQVTRYPCLNLRAEVIQKGCRFAGEVLDFSPLAFRIRLNPCLSGPFFTWKRGEEVMVHLHYDRRFYLSERCRCLRQEDHQGHRDIVLAPALKGCTQQKEKKIRNPRQRLSPSPTLIFDHPFLKKRVRLEVTNISTSGFLIHESAATGVMVEGMIIPELTIDFSGILVLNCCAQVIYRMKEGEKYVRCALVVLDMDIRSYSLLTNVLTHALDAHAYIDGKVDMETLWEFLFNTGFIYPKKYGLIQPHRERFKETYRRLYEGASEIAKHFTYQENGKILAHISMVRAYDRAWMIHHHAARAEGGRRAGFTVLKQILHYLKDLCRLPSARIDYVFCYFRPESRFPDRIYGGFSRGLNDPAQCSLDLFSYTTFPTRSVRTTLPEGWELLGSDGSDFKEFKRFYHDRSGGLLPEIFPLVEEASKDESLKNLYKKYGFIRKWKAVSLKRRGKLRAVLIVNQSDLGLNLSELLNGIKIMVIDQHGLSRQILCAAVNRLTGVYPTEKVPILIYPHDCLKGGRELYLSKNYMLFVLNARLIGKFIGFLQQKFRISYWK